MNGEMNKPQETGAMQDGGMSCCRCSHHLTGPIMIIAVGVVLLLSALGLLGQRGMSVAFALLVIVAGVLIALKRGCKCCPGRTCCRNGKCGPC
jgi:hypothetical protein